MFKYLRIAVTALSLTACVLLVGLWVRSYWWADAVLGGYSTYLFKFESQHGGLEFLVFDPNDPEIAALPSLKVDVASKRIRWTLMIEETDAPRFFSDIGLGWRFAHEGFLLLFPHWLLVTSIGAVTAATWLPWSKRFSLRTLLIVTTLVAVALAAIVYSSR